MLDCDQKGAAIRYTATARRPGKTGSPKTILSNQGATSTSGHETGLRPGRSDIVFGHEQTARHSVEPCDRTYRSGQRWSRQAELDADRTAVRLLAKPHLQCAGLFRNTPMGVMVYRVQVVHLLIA